MKKSDKGDYTMRSGIYKIINKLNNKYYVGGAVNIGSRWSVHKHHLKKGQHHCKHLQRAWDKYGEENFIFKVIEDVEGQNIHEVEQKYLDLILIKVGNGGVVVDHNIAYNSDISSNYSIKSEEFKQHMRDNNPNKKLSKSQVKNICMRYKAGD